MAQQEEKRFNSKTPLLMLEFIAGTSICVGFIADQSFKVLSESYNDREFYNTVIQKAELKILESEASIENTKNINLIKYYKENISVSKEVINIAQNNINPLTDTYHNTAILTSVAIGIAISGMLLKEFSENILGATDKLNKDVVNFITAPFRKKSNTPKP